MKGLLLPYMRYFVYVLCVVALPLWAAPVTIESKNAQVIHTDGIITYISIFKNLIYVGNASGEVHIYEMDNAKKAQKKATLTLPLIEDYFGNMYAPRVFNITTFDGNNLFVLSESSRGGRQILKLSAMGDMQVILTTTTSPKRIVAFDKNKLVVGFLSNEIGLFDIDSAAFIYTTQPSQAGFSNLCVNAPFIFSTDESGVVNVLDVANGKILARLDNINKDNNYQIASSQNVILTAGVDRKMGIYTFDTPVSTTSQSNSQNTKPTFSLKSARSVKSDFLIYAVGISPQATLAAFSKNEQNDISLIHLPTLEEKYILKGATSLINSIIFYDEKTIVSGNDDKNFIIWTLD
ncbi:WD40 repeat domain-containing protein [Helicobacter mastomyrinus]|uniref:WD40 repeat domain-containing protein n=1 Tax=Helicobacter mastomyrinus TaxID=287948 RepID=A0ABZ3F8T8_9HELI|nr:WD40 repeat domain-containing protein [uncultured Helicobacter sp.]